MTDKINVEVEYKAILKNKKEVKSLKDRMKILYPELKLSAVLYQLNHYFTSKKKILLKDLLEGIADKKSVRTIKKYNLHSLNSTIRTRKEDELSFLIIKSAFVGSDNDHNQTRAEIEISHPTYDIEKFDQLLLKNGFSYLSKWSRVRKLYNYRGIVVSIDKNSGYGHIVEFEKVIHNQKKIEKTKILLLKEMKLLDLKIISGERISRMFNYYNKNWERYYQKDKYFVIY